MNDDCLFIGPGSVGGPAVKNLYLDSHVYIADDGTPRLSLNGQFISTQLRRLGVDHVRIWLLAVNDEAHLKLTTVLTDGQECTLTGRRPTADLLAAVADEAERLYVLTYLAMYDVDLGRLNELHRCVLIAALEQVDTKLGARWAALLERFRALNALVGR